MFHVLALVGGFGFVTTIFWWTTERDKGLPSVTAVLCLAVFISSWFTPQGEVYWLELVATNKSGNWLVVDSSEGVTLRH